ncbi:hypothetical protein chiPu_0027406, partial [Chiloscyllium punctatum]|nr:hypothetical protein [Chiloscyllium punctatum]
PPPPPPPKQTLSSATGNRNLFLTPGILIASVFFAVALGKFCLSKSRGPPTRKMTSGPGVD